MRKIGQRLIYPMRNIWKDDSNRNQRTKRLFAFAGWQLWKRLVRKPIAVSLFNGKRFVAHPDCPISSGVLYSRIPNGRNIIFLRKHIPGGTLIDIGANVGSVTLLLADKVQHAILFEPNPTAAFRARENLNRNRLDFAVFELALSDFNGEVAFACEGAVDVCAHVIGNTSENASDRLVQCMTFDDFLRQHGNLSFPVSVVKFDVEGHENSVLRGMRKFLADQRPSVLMFEYLERTNLDETREIFKKVGFQLFEVREDGPVTLGDRVKPLQDLFACPLERVSTFGLVNPST